MNCYYYKDLFTHKDIITEKWCSLNLYLLLSARIIFPAGSVTRAEISEILVLDDMLPKFVPDDSLHRRQTLSLNTDVTSPEKEILNNKFFVK